MPLHTSSRRSQSEHLPRRGQYITFTAHVVFLVFLVLMPAYNIFTGRPDQEEPVIKLKKYASTQIVHDLIRLISNSKDIKIASDQAKRVLRNIRNLNKKYAYFEVEYIELKELEMELLVMRRFRKMGVNEMEIVLYSTKILTFFIWMIAFLIFLYYYTSEEPIDSWDIIGSICRLSALEFVRFVLSLLPFFRYHLIHEGPPENVPTVDFNKMKKEKTAEELTEEVMKEQIKIIDLYSEEVLPLKRKYEQLSNWRMGYKLSGIFIIYIYLFICWLCFYNRSRNGSVTDSTHAMGTFVLTYVMTHILLLPV
ncbi:hypothetical protein CAEBREN_10082 [Caenorhabditis brenneri]|uniref:Uncharacterized protein n=1 Tax=Caenorhabditis brenneri TaxID=135651 RepID=G0NGQ3_CAEBE|nr:hypothetical protein CAEBREN_10082 [Caenorhabditis brenneri]